MPEKMKMFIKENSVKLTWLAAGVSFGLVANHILVGLIAIVLYSSALFYFLTKK